MSAAEFKRHHGGSNGKNGKPRKYGNHKVMVDGIRFDSKLEADTYARLKLLERGGHIRDLRLQVTYPFEHMDPFGKLVNICSYRADFVYEERGKEGEWTEVVADAKGMPTKEYRIKRNLMRAFYGIEIKEVGA